MKAFAPKTLAIAVVTQAILSGYSQAGQVTVTAQDETALEEIVVTGTRRAARSVYDSAAPIDVVRGEYFRNQGASDMTTLLRNLIPSYNVNSQPISDAATVVRPANMRGLASDHTLVLVNSRRRHRAAVISWLGNGVNDGAQGPDISVIPAIAVKQVEVLRDGAAAQYGSDAIAGIINFILKDYGEGGTLEARYGQYSEEGNDEERWSVAGNIGLPFTTRGFFNGSFEYGEADPTSRSIQRDDAARLIADGNTHVANPAQVWGNPRIEEDLKTFFNLGFATSANTEVYSFGNYASKTVTGGFYFRNPNTRGGVFSPDGGVTRLVGDETGDLAGGCPIDLAVDHADGLAAVMVDPNCYVFNEDFPGGFTPSFGADTEDFSFVVGMRGITDAGLSWDISGGAGYNDADFFIVNTVNASLGSRSPSEFDPGSYSQVEKYFNIDVSYPIEVGFLASDLNIAGGFEWRNEEFDIGIGDQASWEVGPLAGQGFSAASNGFPGFGPLAEGDWNRSNIAVYVDVEADITDSWLVATALRWEDFDGFGTASTGKFATHFEIMNGLAIRGTYSTGFRAPTPGQSNAFNISTEFNLAEGDLENNGTIPSTSPVAELRGGKLLEPEESTSYTFGIIGQRGDFSITVDYFNIEIEDRLGISQNFELTGKERAALIDQGVAGADSLATFRFFTNGIETDTEGFDVVATYALDSSVGVTTFYLAYNQTENELASPVGDIIDETRKKELEEALPETRWNLMAKHLTGNWRFMARYSYYHDWYDSEDTLTYDGYGVVDAEVGYTFEDMGLSVAFGADNIINETPDENPNAAAGVGNHYSQWAPGGFNGRFWYTRLIYDY